MSIENARAYIERLRADQDFRDKVATAEDKKARITIVESEGYSFGKDHLESAVSELPEEMLEHVSGGWCFIDYNPCRRPFCVSMDGLG